MVVCKFFQQGNCRYGQSCRFDHIYGSKYSYRAPQESSRSSFNTFNTHQSSYQNSSASSLFRSAVQKTSTYFENSSIHGFAQNQPTRPSVFDRLGPPPSNVFSNQNQENIAKSIFAQANQTVFGQSPTTHVFQSQNQTPNVFQLQNQSPFQTQNQTQNVFQTHNHTPNLFQTQNVVNVFGTSNVFEQNQTIEDDIYSKLEELSKTDIEAFESEDFKLGFIPELPPPKALCAM